MARLPRLCIPGQLHAVSLRGTGPICVDDEDRSRCLRDLAESAAVHGVAVHGFALSGAGLYLLMTPQDVSGLSLAMQGLGRRYVGSFNRRHGRHGALWESRFTATLVEAHTYFFDMLTWIETSAQRETPSLKATDWQWSSARHHVGLERVPWLTEHPLCWTLGNTPFERDLAHRDRLNRGLNADQVDQLTQAMRLGWALGTDDFIARQQARTSRPLRPRPRGRPRGSKSSMDSRK